MALQLRWAPGWPASTFHIAAAAEIPLRSLCRLVLDATEEQLVDDPPASAHRCRSCEELRRGARRDEPVGRSSG